MRLALAQYRELAAFAQFASDLDEATRRQLERGQRVTELMKQKQYSPLSVGLMALSLYAVNEGYSDGVPAKSVVAYETALHAHAREKFGAVIDKVNQTGDYNDDIAAELKKICEDFMKSGAY